MHPTPHERGALRGVRDARKAPRRDGATTARQASLIAPELPALIDDRSEWEMGRGRGAAGMEDWGIGRSGTNSQRAAEEAWGMKVAGMKVAQGRRCSGKRDCGPGVVMGRRAQAAPALRSTARHGGVPSRPLRVDGHDDAKAPSARQRGPASHCHKASAGDLSSPNPSPSSWAAPARGPPTDRECPARRGSSAAVGFELGWRA